MLSETFFSPLKEIDLVKLL
uniref:Uncharacterized protein n=1 Tax=Medicago truncatula TaxID=3880 RepID=B7FG29_MEDTR|nr:unknown [Medicago truncatula]